MSRRGRFVVLEGLDGAGTTTQAALLARALRRAGHRVVLTREPSPGPVGVLLRQALGWRGGRGALSEAALALLFAADRLDHLTSTVEPALALGAVVVSDRYVLSSFAYQGRVLDREWLETLNAQAPAPDLTLFLEVPPSVAAARRHLRGGRAERFDDARTQAAVARSYEVVLRRHARTHHVRRLDGVLARKAVAGQVQAAVAALLPRAPARPKQRLR
ncbi:MAG: dTMP kinase [Myxococcaceae bacterium]